jgi:hypothetical protein
MLPAAKSQDSDQANPITSISADLRLCAPATKPILERKYLSKSKQAELTISQTQEASCKLAEKWEKEKKRYLKLLPCAPSKRI